MADPKKPEKSAQKQKPKDDVSPRRIYRSPQKMIAGVCAGFAEYIGAEVNIVRIIWFVAALIGGVGLVAYILGWIIIPENDSQAKEAKSKGENTALLWGLVLIFFGILFLFRQVDFDYPFYWRWHWGQFWPWNLDFDLVLPIAIILFGIYYLVKVARPESRDREKTSNVKTSSGGKTMEKKLTRSTSDKMLAGVCGGIAQHFNWDPSLVRIGFVLLALFVGHGILGIVAYVVMMIVIPEDTAVEATSKSTKSSPAKTRSAKTTTAKKSK